MITDMLNIPDWVDVTPCGTAAMVFNDPALDPDPGEWTVLDDASKHDVALNKREAEDRALSYCAGCPILDQCASWANRTNVFGVAGGTRNGERNGKDAVDKYLDNGSFPEQEHLVEVWLSKGFSLEWIANRLDVAVSVVVRLRDQLQESETESIARAAVTDAGRRWSRVSPTTIALYDHLSAYGPMPKKVAVIHMADHVPLADAVGAAPKSRTYSSPEARAASGAARYARNVLRIAVRDGNVVQTGEKGEEILALSSAIATQWAQWRDATQTA